MIRKLSRAHAQYGRLGFFGHAIVNPHDYMTLAKLIPYNKASLQQQKLQRIYF